MRCETLLAVASAADFLSTIGASQAGLVSIGRGVYGVGPTPDVR